MGTLQREVEHFRKHASGLANGKGRIAIILTPGLTTEQMEKRIRDVVLHELVHEWQGQLGDRYRGFRPPPWLIEGSAEVLALRFASETAQRRNAMRMSGTASSFSSTPPCSSSCRDRKWCSAQTGQHGETFWARV